MHVDNRVMRPIYNRWGGRTEGPDRAVSALANWSETLIQRKKAPFG